MVNIFTALILSPFIIRRLGDDNYGLWALTVSLAEYYWIIDLGFRSATIKYSAHYRTLGEHDHINEILNTASVLFRLYRAGAADRQLFRRPATSRVRCMCGNPLFPKMLMIVVGALGAGIVVQRLQFVSRGLSALRSHQQNLSGGDGGPQFRNRWRCCWLAMACSRWRSSFWWRRRVVHLLSFLAFRRVFPSLRFSPRFVKLSALRTMLSYGAHSVVASIAQRVLNQGAPLMIGFLLPPRFVGYYSASSRLLDYTVDGIGRVGMVSNPSAAEMVANKVSGRLHQLSVITNRYSLAMFLPLTIFLGAYAQPLLSVWIKPEFAANATGVLLALLAGVTIAQAGQYNSASILFGMGRHQKYARALLIESALVLGGIALVVHPFGIVGAAWVVSILMLLNRGVFTAWLLSRELGVSYFGFLADVYQPLLFAAPVLALLFALRYTVLPGRNWPQLILAGMIGTACYGPLALLFVVRPEHRNALFAKLRERLPIPAR